ncbi:hypothetical protein NB231_02173 [Nitrococcus mobilis Nb-231]|uniref:HDOD domain-containing protein n=1 Tax=Nitrococcus mobilis Nb-231 TaxID=314278 RepID=A4BUH1_9GAMM|nr:hypothetical protein NB231_02173 [Nitrococcus mobilis Nb-231]
MPGLPDLALRVRQAIASESATLDSLARLIAADAVLTTRIMKVVNAAALRRATPVSRLDRAIGALGFNLTNSLVTGLCLLRQTERYSGAVGERLRAHHEHAIEVAAIAHYLAQSTPGLDEQEALLAGLIHDIGALPVFAFAARQSELARDAAALDGLVARHHPSFGARILVEWHFPERFVAVAAEHEHADRRHEGPTDLLDVVIAANLQSRQRVQCMEVDAPALERFNLIADPLAGRDGARAAIEALHRTLVA